MTQGERKTAKYSMLASAFLLIVLAGLLAGCGGGAASSTPTTPTAASQSIPKITITARDFSFDIPSGIQPGYVDIKVVNTGSEDHQVQFARLNNGVTVDQLKEALKKSPEAALPLVTTNGGVSAIKPGQSQEVILNLAEGQYAALCFLAGQDNVSHTEKGMVSFFSVTGASNTSQVSAPQSDLDVILKDFSIGIPGTIQTGMQTIKVTNDGPQPHEMIFVKLAAGKTLEDVKQFFHSQTPSGPPPFEFVTGMGALEKGSTGWLRTTLEPGNYIALCFVPDPSSGKAHAELGMMTAFTVQ